jgi:transcriptional regulator with XRE-family HTH domain
MTWIQNRSQGHGEIISRPHNPASTSLSSRNSFCRRLNRGADARAQFVESHINKGLAYQLRAMREARRWSQEEVAAKVGMPQTAISRLESTRYGKPTITTLKRIAKVYDVALEVRFVPFSKFVDWISGTPYTEYGLSSDAIDVPSYAEEEMGGVFRSDYGRIIHAWFDQAHGDADEVKEDSGHITNTEEFSPPLWLQATKQSVTEKKPSTSGKNVFAIKGELANAAAVGAAR